MNGLTISVSKIPDTRDPQPYQRTYDTYRVVFANADGTGYDYITPEHMVHIAKAIVARDIEETAPWPDKTLKTAGYNGDWSVTVVLEHAYLD